MTESFKVTSEADFIALAPIVLGFQPEKSLVMMTITSFAARIDLPGPEDFDACINALLGPAKRHGVEMAAFVIFDDQDHLEFEKALVEAFLEADIRVVAGLRYMDGRYKPFGLDEWKPIDIASHPLTLQANYQDHGLRHASRREMVERVQPCGEPWDEEAVQVVKSLTETDVDACVMGLNRSNAADAVRQWTKVLRGAEAGSELASNAALVLAFAAWLRGDGAMAWVAHDLLPESMWKKLLSDMLEQAVSPDSWPY